MRWLSMPLAFVVAVAALLTSQRHLLGNIHLVTALRYIIQADQLPGDANCISDSANLPEWELAMSHLVRASESLRGGGLPNILTGRLYARTCEWEMAVAAFENASTPASHELFADWFAGLVYEQMVGQRAMEATKAEELIRQRWLDAGISGSLLRTAGDSARLYGDPRTAVNHYQRSLIMDPSSGDTWSGMALAYEAIGSPETGTSWQNAVSAYRVVLATRPDDRRSWYNLARAYEGLEQWPEALKAHQTAKELVGSDPGESVIDFRIGWINQEELSPPDFEAAVAAYSHALAARAFQGSDTSNIETVVHLNRGRALESAGKLGEAIADYEQAVHIQPAHYMSRVYLARAHLQMDEYDTAEAEALRAIELAPERKNAYQVLGNVYVESARNDEAIVVYNKILTIDPNDTSARKALQRIHGQ